MKKLNLKLDKKQIKTVIQYTLLIVFMTSRCAFAGGANTDQIDNVIKWIAEWSGKIGLVVAFFGGIQVSLAFKNDDADAKVRGLKTLASGFMVAGIAKSLDLFGL